jgi:hypothetical protein
MERNTSIRVLVNDGDICDAAMALGVEAALLRLKLPGVAFTPAQGAFLLAPDSLDDPERTRAIIEELRVRLEIRPVLLVEVLGTVEDEQRPGIYSEHQVGEKFTCCMQCWESAMNEETQQALEGQGLRRRKWQVLGRFKQDGTNVCECMCQGEII